MLAILQDFSSKQSERRAKERTFVELIPGLKMIATKGFSERFIDEAIELRVHLSFNHGQESRIDEVELVSAIDCANGFRPVDCGGAPVLAVGSEESCDVVRVDAAGGELSFETAPARATVAEAA